MDPGLPLRRPAARARGGGADRRREEFAAALERRGARVVSAPAIKIAPLADDSELRAATQACLDVPLDVVIATTGIGFRGWVEAADTWGLADELAKAIGAATVLARGPKARGAIRAAGLREAWTPESESSSEVLEVPVYRWVRPEDTAPLHRLIEAVGDGALEAVAFTSAPAAASFLQAARELGRGDAVEAALRGPVVTACVGPVTAGPFQAAGIPVIQPHRARLGALVREIVEQVPVRCGLPLPAAGHLLDVRGQAVVVDGRLIPLTSASMALLRELAARPGHAVEVAVGRLRAALGDPRIIQTVVKRGYRLAYEPERAGTQDGSWRY